MATTTEYVIILTGMLSYGNSRIAKINISRGYFILFDENGVELYVAKRQPGGTGVIVAPFVPYLSYGTALRFLADEQKLYAISDEKGARGIECKVEVPEG